jgi:hypothetical protein
MAWNGEFHLTEAGSPRTDLADAPMSYNIAPSNAVLFVRIRRFVC